STLTMFDMLLAVFCLLGLGGVLRSWRKGGLGGFFLLAVAIGLGVLAKGPAILVSLLPAVLLAPIWGPRLTPGLRPMTWGAWYIATLGAVMLGAIIALLWAGPAAWMGGEAYRNAIFWGQSAGRMVDSFAHARPWWWYLALMPALLLPWTLWLPFWRGLWRGFSRLTEGGTLFCLVWLLPAFVAFSAISGKQLHYLLPAFPALALLVGRGLAEEPALPRFSDGGRHAWRYDSWPTGFLLLVLGAAVFALPLITETWIAGRFRLPPWSDLIDPRVGIALFVFGFVYLLFGPARVRIRLALMALVAPALVVGVHLGMRDVLGGYYDLGPVARLLGDAQAQGRAIAQFGKYHGQFNLEGRLTAPVTVIEADQDIAPWGEAHPDGLFVTYWEVSPQGLEGAPLPVLDQPFRSDHLLVWTGAQLARWPELGQRRRDLPPRPEPQVPDPENLPPASDEISPAPPLDSKAETP
ncbi:MAG: ArnT family glycosyltransferase, partial [Rhodospirillales bacterium]